MQWKRQENCSFRLARFCGNICLLVSVLEPTRHSLDVSVCVCSSWSSTSPPSDDAASDTFKHSADIVVIIVDVSTVCARLGPAQCEVRCWHKAVLSAPLSDWLTVSRTTVTSEQWRVVWQYRRWCRRRISRHARYHHETSCLQGFLICCVMYGGLMAGLL